MNNDELPPYRAQPTTPWMWPCVVNSCHGWGSDGSRAGGAFGANIRGFRGLVRPRLYQFTKYVTRFIKHRKTSHLHCTRPPITSAWPIYFVTMIYRELHIAASGRQKAAKSGQKRKINFIF